MLSVHLILTHKQLFLKTFVQYGITFKKENPWISYSLVAVSYKKNYLFLLYCVFWRNYMCIVLSSF